MKSLWVKSMCKKGFWVKSLWVTNIGEHRDRWDAGFRSPLLRYIVYIYISRKPAEGLGLSIGISEAKRS